MFSEGQHIGHYILIEKIGWGFYDANKKIIKQRLLKTVWHE